LILILKRLLLVVAVKKLVVDIMCFDGGGLNIWEQTK
jgi:hypothetical protein